MKKSKRTGMKAKEGAVFEFTPLTAEAKRAILGSRLRVLSEGDIISQEPDKALVSPGKVKRETGE